MTPPKQRRTESKDACVACLASTDLLYGERFLSVENEWREQVLCRSCAAKLPEGSYRWSS